MAEWLMSLLREPFQVGVSDTLIRELEQHHLKITFQDELRALPRKHEVQWDERYLWD
jgi:hypothetical protein